MTAAVTRPTSSPTAQPSPNGAAVQLPATPNEGAARILHTSDWQLGMKRHFLGADGQHRFDAARLDAIHTLFRIAVERRCEAIVVAGDVFDDNMVAPRTFNRALEALKSAPVPVFLLPGNHDPYDPSSIFRDPRILGLSPGGHKGPAEAGDEPASGAASPEAGESAAARPGGVTVLTDTAPHEVRPGLVILGAPLLAKRPDGDLVAAAIRQLREADANRAPAEARNPGEVRVLVGHGGTQSYGGEADLARIDVDAAALACEERVVDYVALGDTHSATQLDPTGRVWYSGAPEVTDFAEDNGGGESRSGYALIVDLEPAAEPGAGGLFPVQVQVEEVRVGAWAFRALEAHINSREDAEAFLARLEGLSDKPNTVVKYALVGTVDLATRAWLDERLEDLAPTFAALYPRTRRMDLHTMPSENDLVESFPSSGIVADTARVLAQASSTDPQADEALRLLYRFCRSAGVTGSSSTEGA